MKMEKYQKYDKSRCGIVVKNRVFLVFHMNSTRLFVYYATTRDSYYEGFRFKT